jgi:hypothetical protein
VIKTLRSLLQQDKERFRAPRTAKDAICIKRVWQDGIFLVGANKYSKCYKVTDINYAVASRADKERLFLEYSALLNSFDCAATTKLTIATRRINRADFEGRMLIPLKGDGLDEYRREYNDVLLAKATGSTAMTRELYVTVSATRRGVKDARTYFRRVSTELSAHLARLSSKCTELDATERLRCLHGFYHSGDEAAFSFDMRDSARKGHSFKDAICPQSIELSSGHFKVGDRYGRALYLKDYASYIKDSFLSELCDTERTLMCSIDVVPIPTDEAVREVEKRLLGVEKNITDYTRKQTANQNFTAVIPYDMEQQRAEAREFMGDLTCRDQRMMLAVVTLVHTADSLEQLNADTEAILTCARKHLCSLATLKYQQLDGLDTTLPIGARKIGAFRTLTTEALAVLMPFRVQEIADTGGIWGGENAVSGNMILYDKATLLNPNSFVLGVPGSGKSFITKELIAFLALATDDDIIICDPEREFAPLITALGGEVIRIAPGSAHHINVMDMADGYGEGTDPLIDKSEFILALFEQLDPGALGARERSIIDRCVGLVYDGFRKTGVVPTLVTLHATLMEQPEGEARELALSLELFTTGTLDVFAHPTNVNPRSRMVVFDIMDLGRQLKTMGLLVITDVILNRAVENWRAGRRTHIVIDEFHVMFENEYSGAFFNSAWRRFRKRNAYPTAITQNVEYLLDSVLASTMLSNSEFIVMLNQAASDREKLAKLLNISQEQLSYITHSDAGCGLLRYGSALVPFVNRWPKDTKLYRLMTTRPSDGITEEMPESS